MIYYTFCACGLRNSGGGAGKQRALRFPKLAKNTFTSINGVLKAHSTVRCSEGKPSPTSTSNTSVDVHILSGALKLFISKDPCSDSNSMFMVIFTCPIYSCLFHVFFMINHRLVSLCPTIFPCMIFFLINVEQVFLAINQAAI